MTKEYDADQLNMFELVSITERELKEKGVCHFVATNPDLFGFEHNGAFVETNNGQKLELKSLKAWQDLAEVCCAKLKVPQIEGEKIKVTLSQLQKDNSWHKVHPSGSEKYGAESDYAKVNKNADPHFVKDYTEALERCKLSKNASILNLGVNRGDEFEIFEKDPIFKGLDLNLLGIDHSASAIETAKKRYEKSEQINFLCEDIETMELAAENQYDVLVSINTLHGSKFDGKAVFRHAFQKLLTKSSCVVLGFPNCRYVDGEVVYGGKMKNFSRHDFSLLLKDLQYYRKYLQTHKKKVYITGKYTLFLTGIPV